jgi:phage terminase Nu1 subunit (DNA packaging protein)
MPRFSPFIYRHLSGMGTKGIEEPRVTRQDLIRLFGVNERTIQKWQAEGMPIAQRGSPGKSSLYVLSEVKAWHEAREKSGQNGSHYQASLQARARKEEAQALLAEQSYDIRAGKLLPIEDVEREQAAAIRGTRAMLMSIPVTYAARVEKAAKLHGERGVETVLTEAINEVLTQLADTERNEPPENGIPKKKRVRRKRKQ